MGMHSAKILIFLGLPALLVSVPGSSEFDVSDRDSTSKETVQQVGSSAGLTINVDPETGEILGYRRPDPEALREEDRLRQALSQSDEGLVEVRLPDGSVRVDLQGRFRHINAARLGEHSRVEQLCADRWEVLSGFLRPPGSTLADDSEGAK